MSNKKPFGMDGKGYYIALVLCAAAIGITGYLYQKNATTEEDLTLQETAPVSAAVPTRPNVPAIATAPVPGPTEQRPTAATEATRPVKRTLETASPLPGEKVYGYSMDCLSYNQTTRDWRTHDGIDIAAEAGTPVRAAADGTVIAVFEDDRMGYTVVLQHTDGYTTQYSSLAKDLSVEKGDMVRLGDTLGCVSDSALLESALGDHLHFSVLRNEQTVDPAAFLAIGK